MDRSLCLVDHQNRSGFSLLELLIVITIIGILIAALIPAVEASREAARKTQCKNNLRQLGLAATYHLNSSGFFPSGGWGYRWAGDPDRGFGANQPGGWIYSILPYMEEKSRWSAGSGIDFATSKELKQKALREQLNTPIATLYCPTRRSPALYTYKPLRPPVNVSFVSKRPDVLKTDYAINVGDTGVNQYPGPPSFAVVTSKKYKWPANNKFTGIGFQRSEVTVPEITDGLSHTYLAGEKYVASMAYIDGIDKGDNDAATQGFDNDMCRLAGPNNRPKEDRPKTENLEIFGSAHSEGFNMVFCDGSVHMIDYGIDPDVHSHLANRADGGSTNSNSIH